MAAAQDVGWALCEIRSGAVTVQRVIEVTGHAFAVSSGEMLGSGRGSRAVVLARQVAAYLARKKTVASAHEIGRALNRDHTTIIHAVRIVAKRMQTDGGLARIIWRLASELEGSGS